MKTRRQVSLGFVCLCLCALFVRTVFIGETAFYDAAASAHTRTLVLSETRGKIYARDLTPLVDRTRQLLAAAAPCGAIRDLLVGAFGEAGAEERLRRRNPCLFPVREEISNEFVHTFWVPLRYAADDLAVHLVGTLDAETGRGSTGVERAFDDVLVSQGGVLSVRFAANAVGQVLPGLDKEILDQNFDSPAGVVLTINESQQRIVESALKNSRIESGCAVVMDTDTGEIRALASVPSFDRNNPAAAQGSALSPFTNKALRSYAVGSVFKPIVAAFALESGVSEKTTFTCTGKCKIGDTAFRCYQGKVHGKQTMAQALRHSCNTYFISLLQQLDLDGFLDFCRRLGLEDAVTLCANLQSEPGKLPKETTLRSAGERANFAFGQGELLLTPLHLLRAYHVLATGSKVEPTVFFGTANEQKLVTKAPAQKKERLLSEQTVQTVRRLLHGVVDASSSKANSTRLRLAGKTGTAQSGSFQNGKEICRTWFAGFFPAHNPHYIVVILNENGSSGNADCAPVFKEICERFVGFED